MPWVPRDLYDELLATLRQTRVASAVPASAGSLPEVGAVDTTQRGTATTAPAPAEPAPLILSPAVYEACVRYAFGDGIEKGMNLKQAKRLMRDGHSEASIIAHIRAGGQPVTV